MYVFSGITVGKYKLLDHIKNAHDDTAYPCDDCNKTFIGKRKLKNVLKSDKSWEPEKNWKFEKNENLKI